MAKATICPTVTATTPEDFEEQLDRAERVAKRIHLDLADGTFAPRKLLNPIQLYWSDAVQADIHVMYREPINELETLIALEPDLVIIHAEAEGDLAGMLKELKAVDIKPGIALLQQTAPHEMSELVRLAQHILLFSGDLGHFGGTADLSLLAKVEAIKDINPAAEIGWDGGITAENAAALVSGGVTVLNTGGFIQRAEDPQNAYDTLVRTVEAA